MTYGPNPWQQTNWDWRAAGNFIGGGAGSGLIAATALSGVQGNMLALPMLAGMALVGTGLLCVWLEIGRPLRALHVFFNPRTSWMTREAFVAPVLIALALASAAGLPALAPLAGLAALAFAYCQGRILQAARGIPSWRSRATTPLIVTCALAEGSGLYLLLNTWSSDQTPMAVAFGLLVLARALVWRAWRRDIADGAAPRALAALAPSGKALIWIGTALPLLLLLLALAVSGIAAPMLQASLLALAGALVAATGAFFKFALITRGAFNQGFALPHLPVRGVPRATNKPIN